MLQIGIVGLPNVGKSSLFNALTRNESAEASNYPFTTIEPNVGIVEVPDARLNKLAEIEGSKKIIPAAIKFVDIAGLVEGAAGGAGLGNKFLAHIKEVDAIAMVVRCFSDPNIIHVAGKVDPVSDIKVITLELILSDLEQVTKAIDRVAREAKAGNKAAAEKMALFEKIKAVLESEQYLYGNIVLDENDYQLLKEVQLITLKPLFYIANVSEDQLSLTPAELGVPEGSIKICVALEKDLATMSDTDRNEYLEAIGAPSGLTPLEHIIRHGYQTLHLISYLTVGPQEARAWTITAGTLAPQAAGVIHTDFEKKFIMAEVAAFDKFVEAGGWSGAKERGWARMEGKQYAVQDGDVILFKTGG